MVRSILAVFAIALAASLLAPAGAASAAIGSNDYPYAGSGADQVDQWNFYTRECTSFAAWRLNNDNGVPFNNAYAGVHWGNAENWDNAASAAGIAVDGNPSRGSIAVFNPGVDGVGSYGHVAYVMEASGDQVLIEDYNWVSFAYDQHWVPLSGLVFVHLGNPSGVAAG
ncbi:MAG: CHAP domain-containing protein [Actinocatenispora sp.]